jgi:uncharacterized protein
LQDEKEIERIVHYFAERDEVVLLYLFGSSARGRKTKESDIDIAVLIDESGFKKTDLERFRKEYYAASPRFSLRPVDIVILNTAPPFLKYQVLKKGRILFDKERDLRVKFTEKAITEYLDYKPIQDIYLKAVARRFRERTLDR